MQKRRLIRIYEFGEDGESTEWQRMQKKFYLLNRHHLFEKAVICVTLTNIALMGATQEEMSRGTKDSFMTVHKAVLLGYHIEIAI